jgi:hypothetical protein
VVVDGLDVARRADLDVLGPVRILERVVRVVVPENTRAAGVNNNICIFTGGGRPPPRAGGSLMVRSFPSALYKPVHMFQFLFQIKLYVSPYFALTHLSTLRHPIGP